MKIKTISRIESSYTKELINDTNKIYRNYDPILHPFHSAREYTRSLNATKLEKIFAKPFLSSFDGHSDGVSCITTSNKSLITFISGSHDGELRIWDIPSKKCIYNVYGHNGFVTGLTFNNNNNSNTFFSCGNDKTIKQWKMINSGKYISAKCKIKRNKDMILANSNEEDEDEEEINHNLSVPVHIYNGKEPFVNIDHHWGKNIFATCGTKVNLWDHERDTPIHEFSWGADSILSVKFNPAEQNLLASTGSDRNISLYDTRLAQSLRKVILNMRSNALSWNPMEPFIFTVANEDHNLYTFDMRNLKKNIMVHKDHVSAVMDVSYSTSGQEFVSGSYDRTVRIYNIHSAKSREVYHTKRMQRVFCVAFTGDSKYVLSGSDDTNIRLWKAEASDKLQVVAPREQRKLDYYNTLKDKYKHLKEIKKIHRHRHIPKAIKKASLLKQVQKEKEHRKRENIKKNKKPGKYIIPHEKEKNIIKEIE